MRDLMTRPSHPSSVDRPSAFGSLGRMQREFDRLFEDTLVEGGLLAWSGEEMTPAIDVSENAGAIGVTTDLHGMSATTWR